MSNLNGTQTLPLEEATIEKKDGKYFIFSKEGKKLGGPFKTRKEALKRLRQIEFFKNKKDKDSKHKDRKDKDSKHNDEKEDKMIKSPGKDKADDHSFEVMAQFKSRVLFFTKPGGKDNHTHLVIMNMETEDGVTTIDGDSPNSHQIVGGVVQKSAGHTHELSLTETAFPGMFKTLMHPHNIF